MQIISAIFGAIKAVVKALTSTETQRPPDWIESFILWYVADKTRGFPQDETFNFMARLQTGSMNFGDEQSFLVHLKVYIYWLEKEGLNLTSSDGFWDPALIPQVVGLIPNTLSIYLTGYLSEGAFREFHSKNNDPATTDVDGFISVVKQLDKSSEDWQRLVHEMLTFRLTKTFERRHSEELFAFTNRVFADYLEEDEHDEGAAITTPSDKGTMGSA